MTTSLLQFSIILVTTIQCTLSLPQLSDQISENILNITSSSPTIIDNITIGLPSTSSNDESIIPLSNVTDQDSQLPASRELHSTRCDVGFECVPYYLCADNFVVTDGIGIIDVRFDEDCSDTMKTCCAIGNLTSPPSFPIGPVKSSLPSEPSISSPPSPSIPLPPSPLPSSATGCGIRNINGIGIRITGDMNNETEFGEFPWMVAIMRREQTPSGNENLLYLCGGSLINPSVVITAAHCVSGLSTNALKIRAGEWDVKTILEPLPHQDRDIGQIIVHEEFHKSNLKNDIALIFLVSPVDLAENVRPVCLPPVDAKFDDRRCYATGWGKDKFGEEGKNPVILKKIDLPMISQQECETALRSTRLGKYFELHESFVCAGGEGKDTCKGDGGSPLVCSIEGGDNQYYQVGIVSWGIGCADFNIPGVYVNVMKYRPWIDEIMNNKNLDRFTYVP